EASSSLLPLCCSGLPASHAHNSSLQRWGGIRRDVEVEGEEPRPEDPLDLDLRDSRSVMRTRLQDMERLMKEQDEMALRSPSNDASAVAAAASDSAD
ncbi:hypothetical protein Taro_011090, partial [Colocasia esculenta]|nr:hypothetical protein [Colocasia esculenta]